MLYALSFRKHYEVRRELGDADGARVVGQVFDKRRAHRRELLVGAKVIRSARDFRRGYRKRRVPDVNGGRSVCQTNAGFAGGVFVDVDVGLFAVLFKVGAVAALDLLERQIDALFGLVGGSCRPSRR